MILRFIIVFVIVYAIAMWITEESELAFAGGLLIAGSVTYVIYDQEPKK